MNEPVTIVVRRRVKPGAGTAYEDWLGRLTNDAKSLGGYLGAEFHRPAPGSPEYVSVFRFATLADLARFENSAIRQKYLAEVAPLVEAEAVWEKMTGLEFWFQPPKGAKIAQPSPHRMALLLTAVVFALVLAINLALGPLMEGWPLALRLLATVTLQVALMTYVIMPRLTRVLAKWIYPSTITVH